MNRKLYILIVLLFAILFANSQGSDKFVIKNDKVYKRNLHAILLPHTGSYFYYTNGQITIGKSEDGLKYGMEVTYLGKVPDSTRLRIKAHYKDGMKNGLYLEYERSDLNDTSQFGYYKNDFVNDFWINYRNGRRYVKTQYSDGQKHGQNVLYDKHGDTCLVSKFQYGNKIGRWREYDYVKGVALVEEGYNDKGNLHGWYKKYYNTGVIKEEGGFNNGIKTGEWRHFYYQDSGQVKRSVIYLEGLRNGLTSEYSIDGTIKSKTPYLNDTINGVVSKYNSIGKLNTQTNYVKGEKKGLAKTFYDNDNIRHINTWHFNQLNGITTYFREDSTIEKTVNYTNGVINGITTTYDRKGRITSECEMENWSKNGYCMECDSVTGDSIFYYYKHGTKTFEASRKEYLNVNGIRLNGSDRCANCELKSCYCEKYEVKNEKRNGLYLRHYSNLLDSCYYKNDEQHGEWKQYQKHPQWRDSYNSRIDTNLFIDSTYYRLIGLGNFKNGMKHGYFTYYNFNKNNELIKDKEGEYDFGEESGIWTYYNDENDSVLSIVATYDKGKYNGVWKKYAYDGSLLEDGIKTNGRKNGRFICYTINTRDIAETKYRYEGVYKNDYKVGKWHMFLPDATDTLAIIIYDKNIVTERILKCENDLHIQVKYTYGMFNKFLKHRTSKIVSHANGVKYGQFEKHTLFGKTIEGQYINNKTTGIWTFRDSKTIKKGLYIDKKRNGTWEECKRKGSSCKLFSTCEYEKNVKSGAYKEYFANASHYQNCLNVSGYFINDKKEGKWYTYHEYFKSGIDTIPPKVETITNYVNGKREGEKQYFNSNGRLYKTEQYENNKLIGTVTVTGVGKYYNKIETEYKNDKMNGLEVKYDSHNQKIYEGYYKNKTRHGLWTTYHSNGQKSSEGKYKNGRKTGLWIYWTDNGKKYKIERF